MLDRETLIFWISAQRLRLSREAIGEDGYAEAMDDLTAIFNHTDSQALASRCAEILDREAPLCESSA